MSTAAARVCGAGPSLPQVRRAQPFKVWAWRAEQRESDSILCITKGSAVSSCSWEALLERPLHRSRVVPLPAQSGTLLLAFGIPLSKRRQDQQQHDLTPPHQGVSSIHLWLGAAGRGKGEAGREHPLPQPVPQKPHPKPSLGMRGSTVSTALCNPLPLSLSLNSLSAPSY